MRIILPLILTIPISTGAFDYLIKGDNLSISLTDTATGISPIETIFLDEEFLVTVEGLAWVFTNTTGGDTSFTWETFVDGESVASGTQDLSQIMRELPGSFDAGSGTVGSRSRANIEVAVTLDGVTTTASIKKQAFPSYFSFIPLVLVLFLSATTGIVEFSLFSAIFVGACIIAGDLFEGFKATLDNYILNAVASVDHAYVILFTLFLSGLVGMLERCGGMHGFTNLVTKCARGSRSGQLSIYAIGLFIFFDDYAKTLLTGQIMRPITDALSISREKLAFIVDATAAPIASLTPVSSWIGFEVGLIQDEINQLVEKYGADNLTIETSGLRVFLQTIQYRYYPIFMIVLIPLLSLFQRDFGPMLIAERKVRVYKRIDGGNGASVHPGGNTTASKASLSPSLRANQPRPDQPLLAWNMFFPVLVLICFICYSLIQTGTSNNDHGLTIHDIINKLQASDSYGALLWSTMGAILVTVLFYHLQLVQGGRLVSCLSIAPLLNAVCRRTSSNDRAHSRFLLSMSEALDSLLYGMGRIFPAVIVLHLAWASGSIMTTIGVNRLVSQWITGSSLASSWLPTLSFGIAGIMALATGTSWGTMAIVMPLIIVPTYEASDGNATIVYATIAGILSGAVAGDHMSPISDTTVLSSLACDCNLLKHVYTQAPYAIVVVAVSVAFGTFPIGRDLWSNTVGLLAGAGAIVVFVLVFCSGVVNANGRYDIVTEIVCAVKGSGGTLQQLRLDTRTAFASSREQRPIVDSIQQGMDSSTATGIGGAGGNGTTDAVA